MKYTSYWLILGLLVGSCGRVPLEVFQRDGYVEVNVEALGEYPSTVERIRLSHVGTGQVVWEIEAGATAPQIWRFELKPGSNPVRPSLPIYRGSFNAVVPAGGSSFSLERSVEYRIEVWGSKAGTPASDFFEF